MLSSYSVEKRHFKVPLRIFFFFFMVVAFWFVVFFFFLFPSQKNSYKFLLLVKILLSMGEVKIRN